METIAEISEKIGKKETIKLLIEQLNMTPAEAKFTYALELGETSGDLVDMDK